MGRGQISAVDAAVPILVGAVITAGIVVRAQTETVHTALPLGLAAAAALAARHRAPVITLAVTGGLVLGLCTIEPAAGAAAVFAPAAALYSVGLRRGRAHQVVAALAAVAAILATDLFLTSPATIAPHTLGHAALVAIPMLAADTLRTRRSYVSLLLERVELAEQSREQEARRLIEQERLRIARDLHDVVAHTLTTINVQASVAAHLLDDKAGHARAALATIADASRDALDEIRAVVGVLRDRDSDSGPARAPLEPTPAVETVHDLVARLRDSGFDVTVRVHGEQPERIPDAVGLATYRIVQESLTNVRRHAPGASAQVGLIFTATQMLITIENPTEPAGIGVGTGTGTDTAAAAGAAGKSEVGAGVGIIGMTERAAAIGGTLAATRIPHGFRVSAELPYRPAPAVT
ncbi:histidine kinase [Parafrankia sp. FMc6]|uniref:sensor histidine kinase n=1 Tax=Parafrankia soli TaxID=2599596 RepID=UPI0034D3CE3F